MPQFSRFLFLCFCCCLSVLNAQEICDNGIDDDNDGLVDLNDTTDCNCGFVSVVESLFPNPSFDEFNNDLNCASSQTNGAPDGPGQADCIAGWQQASSATTDAWHLLTYNGNAPFWPGNIPQPIPSGLAVAGFFTAVSQVPGYREYFGSCLPDGPTTAGVEYRLDFQLGFGAPTGNGSDSLVFSPETVELAIYGVLDCSNIPFFDTGCPENSLAQGWELITTFSVTAGQVPSWENVVVDFIPNQNYAALAVGGTCTPVNFPPSYNLLRHYYFVDDLILNTVEVFSNTVTVGGISITGDDICSDDAAMIVQTFPEATYQWYRNGVAIAGATGTEYYPPLDEDFPGFYSCQIVLPDGCGVAGPVELIRPLVTNAFQDSVFFCNDGFTAISPTTPISLVESFEWQDGSSDPFLIVTEPGTYSVTITSFCTQTVETIVVTEDVMPSYEWVIEPENYCLGDTITTYISTDWQLNINLFGGTYFPFLGIGDTARFILDEPGRITFRLDGNSCIDNVEEELLIDPSGPIFAVSVDDLSCDAPIVTASIIAPTTDLDDYTINWTNDDGELISTDLTIDIAVAGSYNLTLITIDEGCDYTRNFDVIFNPDDILVGAAAIPTLSCTQEIATLIVTPVVTDVLEYVWSFEGSSLTTTNIPELTVSESGTYLLDVYLIDGIDTLCRQSFSYEVPFNANSIDVDISVEADDPCLGTSLAGFELTPTLDGWTIAWAEANATVPFASNTDTVSNLQPGDYELRLTNSSGSCQEITSFTVAPLPLLNGTAEPFFIDCPTPEQPVLSGSISVNAVNGLPPYQFRLFSGTLVDSNATGVFNDLDEGLYGAEIIDANGCSFSIAETVEIVFPEVLFVEAGQDQLVKLGNSSRILAQTFGAPLGSVSWSPAEGLSCTDCLNPVVSPIENTMYTITATAENGECPAVDSVFVAVDATGQVYVPNAFSPNQDGVNDLFQFFPDQSVDRLLEFRVYDRWGAEVFAGDVDSNLPFIGWDGTGKDGKRFDPGVFVYLIRVQLLNGDEKLLTGSVTLLR